MFLAPGVTPWKTTLPGVVNGANNPGIRVIEYDPDTLRVLVGGPRVRHTAVLEGCFRSSMQQAGPQEPSGCVVESLNQDISGSGLAQRFSGSLRVKARDGRQLAQAACWGELPRAVQDRRRRVPRAFSYSPLTLALLPR